MDVTQDRTARAEKIGKLLAKAERAGTEEEAEAFFAKAQELMTQWSIAELEARAAHGGEVKDNDGELGRTVITVSRSYGVADVLLVQAVGKVNDCKTFIMKNSFVGIVDGKRKYETQALLYGFELDRLNTQLLYQSLQIFVAKEALRYGKRSGLTGMKLYVARRSFREAFATRIEARLKEARQSTIDAHVAATGSSTLLPALVDKKNTVERYAPRARAGRRSTTSFDPAAGMAGRDAANRADIGGTRIGARTSGVLER